MDSGAAVSVWPRELCADYPTVPTDKTGTKYATAGKASAHLVNEGERVILLKMGDGSQRGARMQVTNVRKPLVSVADMIDAGQDVHFMASGQSYAVHRESGLVTKFVRKKNIFEIEADVPSYREAVAESAGSEGTGPKGTAKGAQAQWQQASASEEEAAFATRGRGEAKAKRRPACEEGGRSKVPARGEGVLEARGSVAGSLRQS